MFIDEIGQQAPALRHLIDYYLADEGLSKLHLVAEVAQSTSGLTFTGMGSSLYASYAVAPAFWEAGKRAVPVEAGEVLHYGLPGWLPDGPLVAISQSGESAETRALAEATAQSSTVIAITNNLGSHLAKAARIVLPMQAGHEAMISTKTYTNTLGALHLLKTAALGDPLKAALSALSASADGMEQALASGLEDAIQDAAERIDTARSVHFIGRGPSMAATYVGALIIGEGARVTAVGLPAASFRHGPMEIADDRHAALLFMPDGPTRPLMEKLWSDLDRTGSRTVALTDRASETKPQNAIEIVLPAPPTEAHFPFVAAIAIERILAAVAERRGLTPGQFRYGGKITDEE